MSFRLRGDSYPGIAAQAPKNYRRGDGNLPQAQTALDSIINPANRQYIEALNVDGVRFLHWSKAMQGYRCTCRAPIANQDDPNGNNSGSDNGNDHSWSPSPEDESFFQVRGVKPRGDRARAEGAYKFDDDMGGGQTVGLKTTPERTATDLLEEFVNENDMVDLLDPNRSVESGMTDSTVPVIGPESRCGICLGTGLTEGYILTGGKRLVLEASGQYPFTIFNMEQDQKKFPYSFKSGIPASGYVEWIVNIPTYFTRAISAVARNNVEPARNVKIMYAFADDNDTDPKFFPLTIEALNARSGIATRLRIRVMPVDGLDVEIGVEFTHVELNFMFGEWQKMQMPPMSDQLNRAVFDSISNISVTIPPTVQNLHAEDFFYETKYDRVWKVVEWTDFMTADHRVAGWTAGLRGLMEYEVGHVLRTFRDPTINIAYGRLEEAQYQTSAKSDSLNYAATYETAREKVRGLIQSLNIGPDDGEFTLDTQKVNLGSGYVNVHSSDLTYLEAAVAHIKNVYPNCRTLWLSPAWFGVDLRPNLTRVQPTVTTASAPNATHEWSSGGKNRGDARLLASFSGAPAYNGTPNDASIIRAIKYLKSQGFRVGLRPRMLMDIRVGNNLPIPNSVSTGQPAYPLASQIEPNTSTFAADISSFFGTNVEVEDFTWDDDTGVMDFVSPSQWSYRRFILHYATLAKEAGGVDAFLIGSDLRKMTAYTETVDALITLLGDVRALLGCATSYEASMLEYGARFNGNAVEWPLDDLWMDQYCSFIALKFDVPMADWRSSGNTNLDGAYFLTPYEIAYLQQNIMGGEYGAFAYTSGPNRDAQTRETYSNDWVRFPKRIKDAWQNTHPRRNSSSVAIGTSAWEAKAKPFAFTHIGVPAVINGMNDLSKTGSKFTPSDLPYGAENHRDDAVAQCVLYAFMSYWIERVNNPMGNSGVRMVRTQRTAPALFDITKIQMMHVPANHISPWHLLNGRL